MSLRLRAFTFVIFCSVVDHAWDAAAAEEPKTAYSQLMLQAVESYRGLPHFPRAAKIGLFEKTIRADPTHSRNVEATYYITLLLREPEPGGQFDAKALAAYRQALDDALKQYETQKNNWFYIKMRLARAQLMDRADALPEIWSVLQIPDGQWDVPEKSSMWESAKERTEALPRLKHEAVWQYLNVKTAELTDKQEIAKEGQSFLERMKSDPNAAGYTKAVDAWMNAVKKSVTIVPERKWYDLPDDEDKAVCYLFSWVTTRDTGAMATRASGNITIAIWRELDERAKVRILRYEEFGADRPSVKNANDKGDQPVGMVLDLDLSPSGRARPVGDELASLTGNRRKVATCLFSQVFPLLFVELPRDFEPAKGFSWGPEREPDSLGTINVQPSCKHWTVTEVHTPLGKRATVVLESKVTDVQSDKKTGDKIVWRRRTADYDVVGHRIRTASERYYLGLALDPESGIATSYDRSTLVITEIPLGTVRKPAKTDPRTSP